MFEGINIMTKRAMPKIQHPGAKIQPETLRFDRAGINYLCPMSLTQFLYRLFVHDYNIKLQLITEFAQDYIRNCGGFVRAAKLLCDYPAWRKSLQPWR